MKKYLTKRNIAVAVILLLVALSAIFGPDAKAMIAKEVPPVGMPAGIPTVPFVMTWPEVDYMMMCYPTEEKGVFVCRFGHDSTTSGN